VRIVMGAKGDFFSPKSIANRQKVCVWGAHRASVCLLLSSALLTSVCLCSRTQHVQAKGLQKLRWYCQARAPPRAGDCVHHSLTTPFSTASLRPSSQLCQKQCRDENGFKCHTTSEGHLRQVSVFNPHGEVGCAQQNSEPCCRSPDVHLWTEREQGGG